MRLVILLMIFCPLTIFGQKWKSYSNLEKVMSAKNKAAEIYSKVERFIPEYRRPFIQRFSWLAIYDYNEYGVLASIKLSQGGLECGWGQITDRGLKGNNYFSIKCRDKKHINGKCFELNDAGQMAHFVKYQNAFDSFRAHSIHLRSHYQSLFKHTRYQDWTYILGKRYAVDRSYSTKLNNIIKTYHLYEFDVRL